MQDDPVNVQQRSVIAEDQEQSHGEHVCPREHVISRMDFSLESAVSSLARDQGEFSFPGNLGSAKVIMLGDSKEGSESVAVEIDTSLRDPELLESIRNYLDNNPAHARSAAEFIERGRTGGEAVAVESMDPDSCVAFVMKNLPSSMMLKITEPLNGQWNDDYGIRIFQQDFRDAPVFLHVQSDDELETRLILQPVLDPKSGNPSFSRDDRYAYQDASCNDQCGVQENDPTIYLYDYPAVAERDAVDTTMQALTAEVDDDYDNDIDDSEYDEEDARIDEGPEEGSVRFGPNSNLEEIISQDPDFFDTPLRREILTALQQDCDGYGFTEEMMEQVAGVLAISVLQDDPEAMSDPERFQEVTNQTREAVREVVTRLEAG